MSHFALLVIGEEVDQQLAPFHEFECTGLDLFIQDIEVTDQRLAEYQKEETRRLRSPDGSLHDPYDDMFYRDPTPAETDKIGPFAGSGGGQELSWHSKDWGDGNGYRAKVRFVPDGWEDIKIPTQTLLEFRDWIADYGVPIIPSGKRPDLANGHKYGYAIADEKGDVVKVVKRTNPNSKWDWYQIGGRWSGFFQLKDGAEGVLGERSLLDEREDNRAVLSWADQCLKRDVDFDAMKYQARCKANETFDKYEAIVAEHGQPLGWTSIRESMSDQIDKARETYRSQPAMKALNKELGFRMGCWVDELEGRREAYVRRCENASFRTFAVVKDGKWYEKGEMGWWGLVIDEKDEDKWDQQFMSLLESLPEDTMLTVVDCHI